MTMVDSEHAMDLTKVPGAWDVWRAVMAMCEAQEVLALERVCP